VYDSAEEAMAEQEINTSVLFVPGPVCEESCAEAIDAGLKLIILITEHIPTHDTMRIRAYVRSHGATLIGPTTPESSPRENAGSASCPPASSPPGRWGS